jgi:flagellar FliL protein
MAANAQTADADVEDGAPGAGGQSANGKASKGKAGKFKLPSKKLMILAAVALLVIGGGVGAYLKFFAGGGEAKPEAAVAKPVTFVDMPEILVNLNNPNAERSQYLKVKVVLELPDAELIAKVQPLMPRVVDQFQTYLRELRPIDLEGSAGLYRLREELTRRVNLAIAPHRINAVLFKEIVVQ